MLMLPKSAGELNVLRLVEFVFRQPSSRSELMEALGLSRATVTGIVAQLQAAELIEQNVGRSSDVRLNGRPPLKVSLARNAAFAVGIDINSRSIRCAVCDLSGAVLAVQTVDVDPSAPPLETLDRASDLTRRVLDRSLVDTTAVIGIGVALVAPVDPTRGAAHATGILPAWDGVNLARELDCRLALPVRVENDATAAALGEHLFGAGRGSNDMLYLRLSDGIGLGMVLEGRLYGGAAGAAGEIGHTAVVRGGALCRCGGRGCLETVTIPAALAAALGETRGASVSPSELIDLAEAGDRGARRLIAEAGETIGVVVAGAVNLLNPELVVVGGELARAGDVLLRPIREAIARDGLSVSADTVKVMAGQRGEDAFVLGAAALQLARAPQALASRLVG